MAPKIVDKEAKKQDILKAAMQVFAAQGVAKSKMTDIAQVAGIGKGTIYEYFRSKDEIFLSAYNYFMTSIETAIATAIADVSDPVDKLRILIDISLDSLIKDGGEFIGIMMDFWAEGVRTNRDEVLRVFHLEDFYARYRIIIAGILDDGMKTGYFRPMDTTALASLIIGAMDGIMLQWIMNKKIINLKSIGDTLFETMLGGIAV